MIEPSKGRNRPRTRRSELERLVDRTVLGPTHPELGTCWRFTGTTTPYGRIAKAQDSYTHRLGWKLLRGPIPEGHGVASPLRRPRLLEPGPSGGRHPRREPAPSSARRHCKHGHPLSGDNLRIDPRREFARAARALRENQRRLRAAASRSPASRRRPGRPPGPLRTDLERLLDRTVLGPTHPELGTCWLFTGPASPYGRLDKSRSERATHRLGWTLLRGPIPEGDGVASPLRCSRLLEPGPSRGRHPRREPCLRAQDTLQARASTVRRQPPDRPTYRRTAVSSVQCSDSAGVQEAPCRGEHEMK